MTGSSRHRPPRIPLAILLLAAATILLLALALLAPHAEAAPFTSPGTGITYNQTTLQSDAPAQMVPKAGVCHYQIRDDITISDQDTLIIEAGCALDFQNGRRLEILGRIIVQGNVSANVVLTADVNNPGPGQWVGIRIKGPSFASSTIDNLTVDWPAYAIRCDGCQGLVIRNMAASSLTQDAVILIGGAAGAVLQNISLTTGRSVVGISSASNITASNLTGSGVTNFVAADNATGIRLGAPIGGSAVSAYGVFLDNVTNASVSGVTLSGVPVGLALVNCNVVVASNLSFSFSGTAGIQVRLANSLNLTNVTVFASLGAGLTLQNSTSVRISLANLSAATISLSISGSNATSVDNATGGGLGAALLISASPNTTVTDSLFAGGFPAAILVNRSTSVTLTNVTARSGLVGISVQNASGLLVARSIATLNTGDGVVLANATGARLLEVSAVANGGRGLVVAGTSGFFIQTANLSANTREGMSATASNGSVADSRLIGNGLDGIVLSGGASVAITNSTLRSNTRNGLWLQSGTTASLIAGAVLANGGNGTLVEDMALLSLTDGRFANNAVYGLYFGLRSAGSWTVFGSAVLEGNPAVLLGGVEAYGTGNLTVRNATVDLRGSASLPFVFALHNDSNFTLDRSLLRNQDPSDRFLIWLDGNASLVSTNATILRAGVQAGIGSRPSIEARGGSVSLLHSEVNGSLRGMELNQAVLTMTASALAYSDRDGIYLDASTFFLNDTTFIGVIGSGLIVSNASSGTLVGVRFLQVTLTALQVTLGSRVSVADVAIEGLTTVGVEVASGAEVRGSGLAVNATSVAILLQLGAVADLDGAVLTNASLNSAELHDNSILVLSNSTISGGASKILASGIHSLDLVSVVAGPAPGNAVEISGASFVNVSLSSLRAVDWGMFLSVAGEVNLDNVTITSTGGTAFEAFDTTQVVARLVTITAADGLLMTNVSSVFLSGVTVVSGDFADGLRIDRFQGASIDGVQLTSGAGGRGLVLLNGSSVLLTSSTVTSGGGSVGIVLGAISDAVVSQVTVEGGLTGLDGMDVSGLSLSNASFLNQSSLGVWLRTSGGAVLQNLTVEGAPDGVLLEGCTATFASRLQVNGSVGAAVLLNASSGTLLDNLTLRPANGVGVGVSGGSNNTIQDSFVGSGRWAVSADGTDGLHIHRLVVDAAASGLHALLSSTADVHNSTLKNLTGQAVNASGAAVVRVFDSSLAGFPGSSSYQAVTASSSALVQLYDTAASNSTFAAAVSSRIEDFWSFTVVASFQGSPLTGASVSVVDRLGANAATLTTNGIGRTPTIYLMEFSQAAAGKSYSSPYRAIGSLPTGFSGSVAANVNVPTLVTIEFFDTQPPAVASRPPIKIANNTEYTFTAVPGDQDNVGIVSYEWTFLVELITPVTLIGPSAAYSFAIPGVYRVTLTLRDAAGNRNSTQFDLTVNAPPYFLPTTAPIGLVSVPYSYQLGFRDPNPEDIPNLTLRVDDASAGLGMSITGDTLHWTSSVVGVFPVTVYLSDGRDSTFSSFSILIARPPDPNNRPPVFTKEPRTDANLRERYNYQIQVNDPEGDLVILQLVFTDALGMSFTQDGIQPTGLLTWDPSRYYFRGVEAFNLTFNVSIRAWDTSNFAYQNFTVILRNPPDEAPTVLDIPDIEMAVGETFVLELDPFAFDIDDPDITTLRWSVLLPSEVYGTSIGFDTTNASRLRIQAPSALPSGSKTFFLTFVLKDPSGLSAQHTVRVHISSTSATEASLPFVFLLIVIGLVGASYAIATRRHGGVGLEEPAKPTSPSGAKPGTSPAAGVSPGAADAGHPVFVEGAALFAAGGEMLKSVALAGVLLDEEFLKVAEMVKSTPLPEGIARQESLGDRAAVLMRREEGVVAAVGVFAGDATGWLDEPMKQVHVQLHARARDSGGLAALADAAGTSDILFTLLQLTAGSSAQAVAAYKEAARVRIASVVELFEGFVRVKIAADNNSSEMAADVKLSIEFDDRVLRLDRVEPTYEVRREKIQLGNLRPGERKTVAAYFDPQICTKSFVNATASYEDTRGQFLTVSMKTRPVEVVCPAFSTAKAANTAMLRRLLQDELTFRDSRYFRFPAETQATQVFESCKVAIVAHDVSMVREFVKERPYQAEAWFYGETKVGKQPMVIWATVYGNERVAQFSVASNSMQAIAGLLAELGERLMRTRAGGGIGAPLERLSTRRAAVEVGERPSLLSKSESGEIDSGEMGASR